MIRHRAEIDPDQDLTVGEARALARQLKAALDVLAADPKLYVSAFMKAGGVSGVH